MKKLLLVLLMCVCICSTAKADMLMSISPASQTIQVGNSFLFTINLRSDTDVVLGGIDMLLFAGNLNGTGSAGSFSSPTSIFFAPAQNGGDWDVSTPGQAFYSRNVIGVAPTTPAGISLLANTTVSFATIRLNTAGAQTGTYNLGFDASSFTALTPANVSVPLAGLGTTFTITAVPEPSTIALTAIGLVTGVCFQRRRKSAAKGMRSGN